jgi:prepilin-type processing-associated H-X9-DG protein
MPQLKHCSTVANQPLDDAPCGHIGHYGINRQIVKLAENDTSYPQQPLSAFQHPSQVYMVFDAGYQVVDRSSANSGAFGNVGFYLPGVGNLGSSDTNATGYCNTDVMGAYTATARGPRNAAQNEPFQNDCERGRHLNTFNTLFADGHVKALRISEARKQAAIVSPGNIKGGAWDARSTKFE